MGRVMDAIREPEQWRVRIETKTALCPGCGRQLKPGDLLRCLEFALSDDALPFAELALEDEVDIDFQQARAWLCTDCVGPIERMMAAVRGTLLKVTGRSS